MDVKEIVVLARNDHREAMRVAAGLTIAGHRVDLIFMSRPISEKDAESDQAELLELAEIEPRTTVPEMEDHLELLSSAELGTAITAADMVVSI